MSTATETSGKTTTRKNGGNGKTTGNKKSGGSTSSSARDQQTSGPAIGTADKPSKQAEAFRLAVQRATGKKVTWVGARDGSTPRTQSELKMQLDGVTVAYISQEGDGGPLSIKQKGFKAFKSSDTAELTKVLVKLAGDRAKADTTSASTTEAKKKTTSASKKSSGGSKPKSSNGKNGKTESTSAPSSESAGGGTQPQTPEPVATGEARQRRRSR